MEIVREMMIVSEPVGLLMIVGLLLMGELVGLLMVGGLQVKMIG